MALLFVFLLGAMLISFLCSVLEATLMSTPISVNVSFRRTDSL